MPRRQAEQLRSLYFRYITTGLPDPPTDGADRQLTALVARIRYGRGSS